MIATAIICGLVSMIGYALANVSSQPLARRLGNAQIIYLRGLTVALVLAIASIPSVDRLDNFGYVLYALGLGLVGYLPLLAFTHGIKISRVGIISPIASTSPLVTVLLAFFILHSPLTGVQWLAVALVIFANISASVNLKNLKESNIANLATGVPFALMAAVGWGLFYFALVYPTRELGPWLSAFLTELGVTLAAGIHLLISREKIAYKEALKPGVVGNGLAIVIGTIAFTVGISKANISIVAALSNSMAFLSFVLAAYFFKERLNRSEAVAAILMVAGVVLLTAA